MRKCLQINTPNSANHLSSYALEKGIQPVVAQAYQSRLGKGAEAVLVGHRYFVSNHLFAHDLGVCSEELEYILAEIEGGPQWVVAVGPLDSAGQRGI